MEPHVGARGALDVVQVRAGMEGERDGHTAPCALEEPREEHGVERQLGHRQPELNGVEASASGVTAYIRCQSPQTTPTIKAPFTSP